MKKTNRGFRLIAICLLCAALLLALAACDGTRKPKSALNPKAPVTVTVWNYYNGDQLAAFDQLVQEFNSTVGLEKGVVVVSVSQGNIDTLADSLLASVRREAGAEEAPSLAAVYSETAFILDQAGALAPLDGYFTKEELAAYVPGFIEEGRFNAANELLQFPILKSTELFTVNETDWAPFAQATGITVESVTTKEALTEAAQKYYEWTDALTPDVPEDGKALYGRDSVANYIYIGSCQLGHELFTVKDGKLTVDLDRATFKTLWDHYYVPYINGYFGSYAKFRSEDCKTGRILALTSSSSSTNYLPNAVTLEDDTTHDIAISLAKDLPFAAATSKAVVQQGASYCLLKGTEGQQEGAVTFLKWFTESERNMAFALMSGYSPVTVKANAKDAIQKAYGGDVTTAKGRNVLNALLLCADAFSTDGAYATKPFAGSKEARALLGDALESAARADREKVVAAVADGATRADAVKPYCTDEYFDAWFAALGDAVAKATAQ